MIELSTESGAVLLPVKVVPGASRTRFLGEWEGRARFAVAAPPERQKANKVLTAFVADLLGIRKRDVSVSAGETSPVKTLRIEGVSVDAVRAALHESQPPPK